MNYNDFDALFNSNGEFSKSVEDYIPNNYDDNDDVPDGKYEVKIEKLELCASKTNKPMVTVWFKILNGTFENRYIFYNQIISQPFQVHIMNNFLKSLDTDLEIKFTTFKQYGELLEQVYKKVYDKLEYGLKVSENKKGFKEYFITDVFDV